MSPASLRVYRAERMLKRDFQALRGQVLGTVSGRLRAIGEPLDGADLEACYAVAWQGLYRAALDGEEIANAPAWLVLVTYRRAIEELRARHRREAQLEGEGWDDGGLESSVDDRDRLRQLLEGMRARLDTREREAAALCYLQGYSRSQVARRMGISETRMRKLMEGSGRGRAGVSSKVGELVETIRDGGFCEEQASMMRALAFGVLDPGGERYRLAVLHHRGCPACRRYVAGLRGVAAMLPPVLTLPGPGIGGLPGLAGAGHHGAAGVALGHSGAGGGVAGAGGAGTLGASAVAGGGGAAGGSWVLGGLGAKLAVGCLLALGIGAGCVVLQRGAGLHPRPQERRSGAPARAVPLVAERPMVPPGASPGVAPRRGRGPNAAPGFLSSRARAAREFGPESLATAPAAAPRTGGTGVAGPRAKAAGAGEFAAGNPPPRSSPASSVGAAGSAQREFSPG